MNIIKPHEFIDPIFLALNISSGTQHKEMVKRAQGKSVVHLHNSDLMQINLVYPKPKEQQKIGTFFQQLDQTITLHQRKLDKLKSLKSAYLSEMFPAEGQCKPKRRFPGFTDDWEQRELGEIASIIGGGTPSTSNELYWNGEINWFTPAEIGDQIFVYESQRKISTLGFEKNSVQILPKGTMLFTSRAGIGKTAILAESATTNQGFQSVVPKKNILDSYFIYANTSNLKRFAETVGAGSTFTEVSGKQMEKMKIMIPSIIEQQQIGHFFQQLDKTITLHQRE